MPASAFVAFAGQSNMVGYAMTLATLASTGWQTDPLTYVWNNRAARFEVMRPTVNTNAYAWGPEVAFAIRFRAAHPKTPLYIVKTAAGDTSLAQDLNAEIDWSPASRGEMFDRAQVRIDAASKALGKRPDAVFISQGEADATDRAAAQAYHANFRAYVDAVRTRWMKNAQGYVAWTRIAPGGRYARQVADAQAAVDQATARTDSFPTSDETRFPRQRDRIHLTARGLVTVGDQFFRLYETNSSPAGEGGPPKAVEGASSATRATARRTPP
jgi:hypothetical protein